MLKGSGWPSSVTSGMSTFLLCRYFASILYGCRLPDVKSNVMLQMGPLSVSAGAAFLISSVAGPMAMAESCLSLEGGASLEGGGGASSSFALPFGDDDASASDDGSGSPVVAGVGAEDDGSMDSVARGAVASATKPDGSTVEGSGIFSMGTASMGCSRREVSSTLVLLPPLMVVVDSAGADMLCLVMQAKQGGRGLVELGGGEIDQREEGI